MISGVSFVGMSAFLTIHVNAIFPVRSVAAVGGEFLENLPLNFVIKPRPNDGPGRMLIWDGPLQDTWLLQHPSVGLPIPAQLCFARAHSIFSLKDEPGGGSGATRRHAIALVLRCQQGGLEVREVLFCYAILFQHLEEYVWIVVLPDGIIRCLDDPQFATWSVDREECDAIIDRKSVV